MIIEIVNQFIFLELIHIRIKKYLFKLLLVQSSKQVYSRYEFKVISITYMLNSAAINLLFQLLFTNIRQFAIFQTDTVIRPSNIFEKLKSADIFLHSQHLNKLQLLFNFLFNLIDLIFNLKTPNRFELFLCNFARFSFRPTTIDLQLMIDPEQTHSAFQNYIEPIRQLVLFVKQYPFLGLFQFQRINYQFMEIFVKFIENIDIFNQPFPN